MRVIIIGCGVAGQTIAENLRKTDPNMEILMITEEPVSYYSRIYLPHYIAGEKTLDQLVLRKNEWYQANNVSLILDAKVSKIDPENHHVYIESEEVPLSYDKLALCPGSSARKLPFGNPNVHGMYTLRSVVDADTIIADIKERSVKNAFIIGGGLLGIELGYHLSGMGLKVTICEVLPYLLPRQLDEATAALLKKYLESKGINVICGIPVKKVIGDSAVTGVEMENGSIFATEVVFQQMGIIPNIQLAKDAGLSVDKGIIVNEFMQTSHPDIVSAGDCVQFQNTLWGIIPASLEQSKFAVNSILGKSQEPYKGTTWVTKLKVAGIQLACYGIPPKKEEPDSEIVEKVDEDCFLCRKVLIKKGELKGAILMGGGNDQYFLKNMGKLVDKTEIHQKLNE
jgi:nitrite reductase (NADH) large subunit